MAHLGFLFKRTYASCSKCKPVPKMVTKLVVVLVRACLQASVSQSSFYDLGFSV